MGSAAVLGSFDFGALSQRGLLPTGTSTSLLMGLPAGLLAVTGVQTAYSQIQDRLVPTILGPSAGTPLSPLFRAGRPNRSLAQLSAELPGLLKGYAGAPPAEDLAAIISVEVDAAVKAVGEGGEVALDSFAVALASALLFEFNVTDPKQLAVLVRALVLAVMVAFPFYSSRSDQAETAAQAAEESHADQADRILDAIDDLWSPRPDAISESGIGIEADESYTVREGPGDALDVVVEIEEGQAVRVLGQEDAWLRVSFEDGAGETRAGWIRSELEAEGPDSEGDPGQELGTQDGPGDD